MADRSTTDPTEARLQVYLQAELRAAERDFPALQQQPIVRRVVGLRVSIGLALVAVAAILAVLVVRPLPLSPVGGPQGPTATATDGTFTLDFSLSKHMYLATEPIEGQLTLSVTDGKDRTLYGSRSGLLFFSYVEVGGTRHMERGSRLDCRGYAFKAAEPMTQRLAKSLGWDSTDPNAAFYQAFSDDPQIHLPAGTWDITALATFSEGDALGCGGTAHNITATIRITVVPEGASPEARVTTAEPTQATSPQLAHFEGVGFRFDYPDDWPVISGYGQAGMHGPTVLAAVGIGDFDLGCTTTSDSVSCPNSPTWTVPSDGVVLAYHVGSWLGPIAPEPTPSLGPGDAWVVVDGRVAVLSRTDTSMTWHLAGAPEFIEARWGPDVAQEAPGWVEAVIASWHWESSSPSAVPTEQPTPVATPAAPASCPVTQPDPAFAAPSPYPSHPFSGRKEWYGSEALWTILDPAGEVWSGLPLGSGGLTQKTFWFSTRLSPPLMTVSGMRLDGPGSFTSAPGTNATSSDFGEGMLVGIVVPTPGCWQITGHYRGAGLSYVVWIPGE
jgi:hypothetical protein